MKTTRMLLIILAILTTHVANATEVYEFYNGSRQMGMGGVVVTSVNDETALISNPAALGKLRNSYLTILDPEADGSTNDVGIMKQGGGATTGFTDPQKLLDKCLLSPDKHFHGMGQLGPSLVVPNFGFGVHAKYQIDGEFDSVNNVFNYRYINDAAVLLGFNFRIWDGRIKFGFNAKVINRVEIDRQIPTTATGLKIKDLAKEGVGVGSDVGLLLTAPWTWLPTLGAVMRDAGATSFNMNDGFLYNADQRPNPIYQTVDVGLGISPILGNKTRTTIGVEYRDVLTYSKETDQMRRFHAGLELNFADMIFLRGGLNQRYWTAGLEFSMYMFQFQVASYGEEIGTKDTPKEDRRYMGKFAFRF